METPHRFGTMEMVLNGNLTVGSHPSENSIEFRCAMQASLLRFSFLITSALIGLLPATPTVAVEKPNIILLFADDQRADTIGAHGNAAIKTPNLRPTCSLRLQFSKQLLCGFIQWCSLRCESGHVDDRPALDANPNR